MPLAPEYFTADMARALPDDGERYEVVWGELLVTPSPARLHQRVVSRLLVRLYAYCARFDLGEVLTSPADISWSEDTLVQPDVFVIAREEADTSDWASVKTLRLVAEVLSPSTAHNDRFQKRKLYQAQNVETLWLVDIDAARVEVWAPAQSFPAIGTEQLSWHPQGAAEPLVIPIADLFR